jgi:methyl-accepting chemotaxis protein
VVTWIGKDSGAPASPHAITLGRLDPWLREPLEASLPSALRAAAAPAREAALTRGDAELLRCFVALADGAFVQLPAGELPTGYDPRSSPWYRRGLTEPELHWTRPVSDVAGKTLRLQAVAAVGAVGQRVGVAGCDLRVSALAQELTLALPGFRRAYLVTKEGRIAASEDLERRVLRPNLDPDEDLDLPMVESATLAAHVAAADTGGYFEAPGDTLIVYTRLISTPWTYVAELDASRHFAARAPTR